MNIKRLIIKGGIERLGGIERKEFTSSSGELLNRKVELDILQQQNFQNRLLRSFIVGELATSIAAYGPDIIVPVPEGADHLGDGIARRLYLPVAYMEWIDKSPEQKRIRPRTQHHRELLQKAGRIALIDDVFRTGGNLLAIERTEEVAGKVVVAGEVWDRSENAAESMPFPVESIVHEHIPAWVDEQ